MAPLALVAEQNQILSEIKFDGSNKDEKTAGVWVDGQYVGFVKELKHDKKLLRARHADGSLNVVVSDEPPKAHSAT